MAKLATPRNDSLEKWHALRLSSGVWMDFTFPYKAGSSEWLQLTFKHVSGRLVQGIHSGFCTNLLRARPPMLPVASLQAANVPVVSFCLVRNPYERLLSVYLNKYLDVTPRPGSPTKHLAEPNLWPPRMPAVNGSYATWVRLAKRDTYKGAVAKAHYAPITATFHRCTTEGVRVYKMEQIASWYAPFVRELGLEQTVATGWPNGCFYAPPGRTCENVLETRESLSAADGDAAPAPPRCDRGNRSGTRHSGETGGCARMVTYYTPELAQEVTDYAYGDLNAFHYPVWDGDVANPWF